ncbi:MAG TPA: hypothetical protein ENK90_00685 [Epsilonproteobacteria bacterium]|nr:hypothetical protein [Campylobacterota bacterium]
MSKKIVIFASIFAFITQSYAGCSELSAKHSAPDPSTKTMKQIERWVKRKVKGADASALKECLIAKAADNPNKAAVAGN